MVSDFLPSRNSVASTHGPLDSHDPNYLKNLELLKCSRKTRMLLHQMTQKQSILNQIDVHNQIKSFRDTLKKANYDNSSVPQIHWYSQLRAKDNGQFTRVATLTENHDIDYKHKQLVNRSKLKAD